MASKPVRFGIIGTSWITASLIDAGLTVPGFEIAAVHSRDAAKGAHFAAPYGAPRIHTTVAALAADPQVGAVYVASPNSMHAAQSIELLRAGKHVLCEKPIAANARQATAAYAAAEQAGRLLMEAYTTPFEPNSAALAENLPRVGQVRRAVWGMDQYSSRYDRYKAGEHLNAFDPAFASGSLMDLGIYVTGPAVHLFGPPAQVSATGILLTSGVDGQGTIILGYDGFEVLALHSKIASSDLGVVITGESGTLSANHPSVPTQVRFTDRAGQVTDLTREQSIHHMRYEVEHFLGLLAAGQTASPVHSPARSLQVMAILDEARRQVGVTFPADAAPGT
ncbi:MAG: Gfo/Idh/MocA family protein [Candidatus Nanopelagicales bacterium]